MRVIRILLLAGATNLLFAPLAQSPAQSPGSAETLEAAKTLVSLVSGAIIAELTTKMTAQIWPAIAAKLRSQNATIDADTLGELRNEFEGVMNDYMAQIMTDAPAIYARYFTAQEMQEIVSFYKTPTGAKTLSVMPQATADFFAAMMPHLQGLQEKVNQSFLALLQKRGYQAQ